MLFLSFSVCETSGSFGVISYEWGQKHTNHGTTELSFLSYVFIFRMLSVFESVRFLGVLKYEEAETKRNIEHKPNMCF